MVLGYNEIVFNPRHRQDLSLKNIQTLSLKTNSLKIPLKARGQGNIGGLIDVSIHQKHLDFS